MIKDNTILLTTFHPELTDNDNVHKYFIEMAQEYKNLRGMQRDIEDIEEKPLQHVNF